MRSPPAARSSRTGCNDVLAELPELIGVEETEEFGSAEADAYRRAVISGNFMAMRQAAYPAPGAPIGTVGKLRRLLDIVAEAAVNGRKAVVFSYFRDVLETVRRAIGTELAGVLTLTGPIDGSVPPAMRQRIVDEFTTVRGPAVLVSRIAAGGIGWVRSAACRFTGCSAPRAWTGGCWRCSRASGASSQTRSNWSTRRWPTTVGARSGPTTCRPGPGPPFC